MEKIKILVGYHKPSVLIKDHIFLPIYLGAAASTSLTKDGINEDSDLNWLKSNMISDNEFNNISEKNRTYNEMTGIYWAWKNQDQIKNPEYIGFNHYRRFFSFGDSDSLVLSDQQPYSLYRQASIDFLSNKNLQYLTDNEQITNVVKNVDIIIPKPTFLNCSVYEQYAKEDLIHIIDDLDKALAIVEKESPHIFTSAQSYIHSNKHYFWNMFIMKRQIFNDYCDWIFHILDKLEEQIDLNDRTVHQERVFAYIAERLTGIYFTYLLDNKHLYLELPTVFVNNTDTEQTIQSNFSDPSIPVVFSSDNNYAPYLAVAIQSLIKNSNPNNNYDIFIIDGGIDPNNKLLIQNLAQQNNIHITFININPYIKNIDLSVFHCNNHFTIATYFRFFIPRMFSKFKKIVYLDCDIVILSDIADFYNQDLNNHTFCAVKDVEIIRLRKLNPDDDYFENTLRMNTEAIYFQAGVLLFNIQKMLQNNFEESCLQRLKEIGKPRFVDQDVLNSLFSEDVQLVETCWNVEWQVLFGDINASFVFPTQIYQEYLTAHANPKILHYCSKYKPWKTPSLPKAQYFWTYAKQTEFYESILFKNLETKSQRKPSLKVDKKKYFKYFFLSKVLWGKRRKRYKHKFRLIKLNQMTTDLNNAQA